MGVVVQETRKRRKDLQLGELRFWMLSFSWFCLFLQTAAGRIDSKYRVSKDIMASTQGDSTARHGQSSGSVTAVSYHPSIQHSGTGQMENSATAVTVDGPPFTAIEVTDHAAEEEDSDDEMDFMEVMYPKHSSSEFLEFAALGVLILWTTFFAFNCGTTESVSGQVMSVVWYLF